jgi:predicted RNase H-like HicB family nuclease
MDLVAVLITVGAMGRILSSGQMALQDYEVVLYRQQDGSWVAEIPAIAGCYVLMETREAALGELGNVVRLISEEYREKGLILPSDHEDVYLPERALDRIRSGEEHTIPLEDVMKRHDRD